MTEDFAKYNGEGTMLRKAQLRLLEIMVEFDRICKEHNIPYFLSGGTCLGAIRHGGFIPWDDDVDIDVLNKDYKRLLDILKKELPAKYFLQNAETDKGFYQVFTRIVDKNSRVTFPNGDKIRKRMEYKGLFLDIFPIEKTLSYRLKKTIDYYYLYVFRAKRGIKGSFLTRVIAYMVWPFLQVVVAIAKSLSVFSSNEKLCHVYGTKITPKLRYSNIFPVKPMLFEGMYFSGPAKPHEYLTDLYGKYAAIPPADKRKVHTEKIEVYT